MLMTAIKLKQLIMFTLIVILEGSLTSTIFSLFEAIGKYFDVNREY